jgi:hypothetical protein
VKKAVAFIGLISVFCSFSVGGKINTFNCSILRGTRDYLSPDDYPGVSLVKAHENTIREKLQAKKKIRLKGCQPHIPFIIIDQTILVPFSPRKTFLSDLAILAGSLLAGPAKRGPPFFS